MVFGEMESDFRVAICTTGLIFLVLFCSVASVANGLLLVVLYKDPSRCFRKPIVVYIAALALMDFLSGSVTGIGVIYNYILCALGKENPPHWKVQCSQQFSLGSQFVQQIC